MQTTAIESEILSTILGSKIESWRIGLTHDLRDRYTHWKHTEQLKLRDWYAWPADSLSTAQYLEAKFIDQGMQGGTGGNLSPDTPVFVYIFA